MPSHSANMPAGARVEDPELGTVSRTFSVSADELVRVVEERDLSWVDKHGGTKGVANLLNTSPTNGIQRDEIAAGFHARVEAYGPNRFKYPPPKSFARLMLEAFKDVTIIILSVASVISLTVGLALSKKRSEFGYLEGLAIVLVVLIVVMVQATIDYKKEQKFRQLNSVKDNYQVQAFRGGEVVSIVADDVLVGDVLKISAGDKIPADGLLLEGANLKTNESAMTGEVIDIRKTLAEDPFLLSGTTVSEGVGRVVIVAVGERSQWGTILSRLIVEPEDTPLQVRLDRLAMNIGKIGILFAVATFVVSMIRWGVRAAQEGKIEDKTEVLDFFIDSVTIVVVAIPEGLPLAITLGLAFAMRKMMKDNNLVRRLEACETMGSATQLNADKTGTLTQNRMTVVEATWDGQPVTYFMHGGESAVDSQGVGPDAFLLDAFKELVAVSIAANTQASLHYTADGAVEHLGNKTECALLQLVESWGKSYSQLRRDVPTERVYLFDSNKKRMSSTISLPSGVIRLFTKGAPEIVVKLCDKTLARDGTTVTSLDEYGREEILGHVNGMAARGLRTLLLAYRDVQHSKDDEVFWKEAPESDLTYIGVVGIKDPIRPETKEAVRLLKGAGVSVRMVTGDNPLTAKFIAEEAGILDDDGIVMQGPEFRKMSETQRAGVAKKIQVLARSTPNDKLILVRDHKRLGEVVSVTGDGTNDAPALKEADVGFALGIAGTEIAKEACDIVILDDNIQSMAKAVLWGRNVYESIRKFLQFQLVVNVVAVTLNFLSACSGRELPLSPVPLLWVNMIMDSMGALALATEAPRPELMKRKPFGRRAPLINRAMYRNIIGISIYQLAVCLFLQYAGRDLFNLECKELRSKKKVQGHGCPGTDLEINSIIFNSFVFMQVASEINSRRIPERNVFAGILRSYMFLIIVCLTIVIQIALMTGIGDTRIGESIGIGKISGAGWAASLVFGVMILPWGYLVRLWPLDWSVGPMDDKPTEMSKLEKLLHFPQRKDAIESHESDSDSSSSSSVIDESPVSTAASPVDLGRMETESPQADMNELAYPPGRVLSVESSRSSRQLPARIRLRIFVHAVAFVNVVSRPISRSYTGEGHRKAS